MYKFLRPTYFIDCDSPEIIEAATSITKDCKDKVEEAVALFRFARDEITYNPYGPVRDRERYKASHTLQRRYGYCIQKATLLAGLLRAVSIPATLVFADIRNQLIPQTLKDALHTDEFVFHCYNDIFVGGRWLKATCAFDSGSCEKINVPPVEFSGTEDAIFPPFAPDGRRFVTYLRQRAVCDDVPFEDIIRELEAFYGEEVLEATSRRLPQ